MRWRCDGWLGCVWFLAIIAVGRCASAAEPPAMPATGPDVPELASFDRIVTELIRKYELPGGAVAVAKDGRLVLARGYGLADVEKRRAVEPDSLFRIASVSKPITAAAILVLVQRDRLDLDAKVVTLLGKSELLRGKPADPRFGEITVRQLLHHTGGFDRGKSFDPMLQAAPVVEALGTPADRTAIVRFMFGRPLDFDPGTRYAYSNFGYCLLGRVIEAVTGRSYVESVKTLVLQPAGIDRMRLGRTRLAERADAEVRYYPAPGSKSVASVFPEVNKKVPSPYGRYYIEAMDAHGGWIASVVDLLRFATWADGSRQPGLLEPATVRLLRSRPAAPVSVGEPAYYGLGWLIRPVGEEANWWHAGGLPGTVSFLVRTHHGLAWAAVFNGSPKGGKAFYGELDRSLWRAAGQVERWPDHDLFERHDARDR